MNNTNEIADFVKEHAARPITMTLEYSAVHNTIAALHSMVKSSNIQEEIKGDLVYCMVSLVFLTIEVFPECAFLYYKDDLVSSELESAIIEEDDNSY